MDRLKIALLQIAPGQSLQENKEKGARACALAKEKGADIALFPEMWSCGYRIYGRPAAQWQAEAISLDSPFVPSFVHLAASLEMAIGVTLLESTIQPRNTLVLFDRTGARKLVYAKVHTCDFGAEHYLTPGDDFSSAELDTAAAVPGKGSARQCLSPSKKVPSFTAETIHPPFVREDYRP